MKVTLGQYQWHFRLLPTIIASIIILILCRLGFWQIERATEKIERLQRLERVEQNGVIDISQLLTLQESIEVADLKVSLFGNFVKPYIWLIDNQIIEGQVGYDVLVPLKIEGLSQLVLVNLGWIKGDYKNRNNLPNIDLPTKPIHVVGRVKSLSDQTFRLNSQEESDIDWPKRIQTIDLNRLQQALPRQVFPYVFVLDEQTALGFKYHYKPVVTSPQKHYAYAMQWLLLALGFTVVYLLTFREKIDSTKDDETV